MAQDGKSVTIKVRPGVKFSNGKEVTAEDFNFSVERAKDPKVGSLFRPQASLVTKTEAPDKSTAVWRFDAPFPAIVDLLARQFIVSKETIDLDNWKQRLIGTGPFTWEEWQPGERALWKRNANYYEKDLPYLDEVEVRSFGDANTMAANLESGQVDVIARLPMTEVARLKANNNLKVFQAPVRLFYDVLLQSISAPFENKLLRQAINWGIDRERFVRTTLVGLAPATSQPFPSHSWAWFPELDKTYTFNLDKAKELMTQAGHPERPGDPVPDLHGPPEGAHRAGPDHGRRPGEDRHQAEDRGCGAGRLRQAPPGRRVPDGDPQLRPGQPRSRARCSEAPPPGTPAPA